MSDETRGAHFSYARTVSPTSPKLQEAATDMRQQFAAAKDGQTPTPATERDNPAFSHARTVSPTSPKLQAASNDLQSQYNRARALQLAKTRDASTGPARGSDMVRTDQPKPTLAPEPPLRDGPDRDAYNARLSRERQKAHDYAAGARAQQAQHAAGRGREPGRGF